MLQWQQCRRVQRKFFEFDRPTLFPTTRFEYSSLCSELHRVFSFCSFEWKNRQVSWWKVQIVRPDWMNVPLGSADDSSASPLTITYRWARQASTRSSCCSAAGPGSSGWLAPYPGSCWASQSTASYLPRDKHERSSLIVLSSRSPLAMGGQRVSEEKGKKVK